MKPKKFRLNAKNIFLTYSQTGNNITHSNLLEELRKKVQIENHLIGIEKHQDGGIHAHILLLLKKRCNLRSPKCLDLSINDKIIHGKYETAKNIKALMEYIIKDGNYMTDMKFEVHNNKIIEPEEHSFREAKAKGSDLALKEYKDKYPERAYKKFSILQNNIEKAMKNEEKFEKNYLILDLDDFELDKLEKKEVFQTWWDDIFKVTLIIRGLTGKGKSLLAQAIMQKLGIPYLEVTNYEGLKNLTSMHKGIIFDDANLSKLNTQEMINLVETRKATDLRILYKTIRKPAGLIQIITINKEEDICQNFTEAILRRVQMLNVPESIVQKVIVKLNIQNNYNSIVNNNNISKKE